jgi:S1-C subfamily serine protease
VISRSRLVSIAAAALLWLWTAAPGAAADPAIGTVYISLVGQITLAVGADLGGWRDTFQVPNAPLATGSGFLVSSSGYVITNHHVIQGGRHTVLVSGQMVDVTIEVQRIEVVVPGAPPGRPGEGVRRLEASVVASDADLDLAVLYVGGTDLPYVPLGDSGDLEPDDPLTVLGFPLGRGVALDLSTGLPVATVSRTPSIVSSMRSGDAFGTTWSDRMIELSGELHPGNSGGPVVDRDGYVVGVVHARAKAARRVGFAIPAGVVRQFLVRQGLDAFLPTPELTADSVFDGSEKGLRLVVPPRFDDVSRTRVQVHSGSSLGRVSFLATRVASRWRAEQIEALLLRGQAFDTFTAAPVNPRPERWASSPAVRAGYVKGRRGRTDLRMVYAVVALGREAVVARYVGPADDVAFNVSSLRVSLASLAVTALLTAEVDAPVEVAWAPGPGGVGIAPAGWSIEDGGPAACPDLPARDVSWSSSPAGDFTVELRLAFWRTAFPADAAARQCASDHGIASGPSYTRRFDWLGASYEIHGVFAPLAGGGVAQIERRAPVSKVRFVDEAFAEWLAGTAGDQAR